MATFPQQSRVKDSMPFGRGLIDRQTVRIKRHLTRRSPEMDDLTSEIRYQRVRC